MSKEETKIQATLSRANAEGDVLSSRKVQVRSCWGEEPPLLEIVLEDNEEYFDYLLIDIEKLKSIL